MIPSNEWSDIVNAFWSSDDYAKYNQGAKFTWKGKELVFINTMYGDGTYESNTQYTFGVDSGMICCVPLELCDKEKLEHATAKTNSCILNYIEPIKCSYHNGTIKYGMIHIYTEDYNC